MADSYLGSRLRDHLRDNGLLRKPIASDLALHPTRPPAHVDPRHGVPAPNDQDSEAAATGDPVIGLIPATSAPTRPYEGFLRRDFLEIVYRATNSTKIFDLDDEIALLIDDKRGFQMGGLRIEECLRFRGLSRLRSDEQGYTYVTEYQFLHDWTSTP